MLKKIKLLFILFLAFSSNAQNMLSEIKELKNSEEIDSVWQNIFETDQKYRSENTNDSIDNLNFKKTILMIKHHGYPEGNITPNIVFVHQRSNFVCEYYFPIFYQAFISAKADTFWFLHNVRRLHRGRYDRDFLQPDVSNYSQVISRLIPYLNKNIDYSIEPFDNLYHSYIDTLDKINSYEIIGHWHRDFYGDYNLFLYQKGEQLFIERKREKSIIMPQEVLYNKETKTYTYKDPCCGIEYQIIDDNMCKYVNGELKSTFTPIQ